MGALRLVLALSVALAHIQVGSFKQSGIDIDLRWGFGTGGIHAVILFYVISGFLMSYVLEKKYPADARGTTQFYLARMLRIYPLWIALNAALIVMMGGWAVYVSGRNTVEIWAPLLLLWSDMASLFTSRPHFPYFDANLFLNAAAIGWTLGAEVGFYALAPFLFRSPRLLVAAVVGSLFARIGADFIFSNDMYTHGIWMYFFFPSTLIFFLLGHLARLLHHRYPMPSVLGWGCLAASLIISTIQNSGLIPGLLGHFSVVLFALSLPTVFEATKDNRVSNFLGDLSYPLYLFHLIAIECMYGARGNFLEWGGGLTRFVKQIPDPYFAGLVAAVIFSAYVLAVAAVVHFAVERPLTIAISAVSRVVRRLAAQLRPRSAPVTPSAPALPLRVTSVGDSAHLFRDPQN